MTALKAIIPLKTAQQHNAPLTGQIDLQIDLFDGLRAPAERPPKLSLPFQLSNTIDTKRAARIFHVSEVTLGRMLHAGHLRGYKKAAHTGRWEISYTSVVEYCDRLRVLNGISDTRVPLAAGRKRRSDDDLLPFPWKDTITTTEVQARLDCDKHLVLKMIESGTLVAYQVVVDTACAPWRIYGPSLDRHLERLNTQASNHASRPSRRTMPTR